MKLFQKKSVAIVVLVLAILLAAVIGHAKKPDELPQPIMRGEMVPWTIRRTSSPLRQRNISTR